MIDQLIMDGLNSWQEEVVLLSPSFILQTEDYDELFGKKTALTSSDQY
jgi:hypothetical protein